MIVQIIQDTTVLTGISCVLGVLLVLAERVLSNYGDFKININGKKDLVIKGGNSLLSSLAEKQIFLPSACGGRGTCGACKCKVTEGGGPVLPTERPLLSKTEQETNVRLACQVKVKSNVFIKIPDEIFNIRKFNTTITEIIDYTYDIKGITFKLAEGDSVDFKAGQYMQINTKPYAKVRQSVSRAYSISSTPDIKDALQLIIRLVPEGICTTWVHQYLNVGDQVELTGPYGDFYIRDTDADIIFVAGGSGKAPIKSMLEHLQNTGCDRRMTYYFGARTVKDLYLTEEMKAFEQAFADFRYEPMLSQSEPGDGWTGKTGFVMPYFKERMRDPQKTEAYLCGSPGMINAVTKSLKEMGMPEANIFFDSFG